MTRLPRGRRNQWRNFGRNMAGIETTEGVDMNEVLHLCYHWLFPVAWWSFVAYWLISALWVNKTKVMESPITRAAHFLVGSFALLIFAFDDSIPRRVNWKLWPQNEYSFWIG